jgi:pyruvate, orthophosphate dikinase
MEIQKLAQQYIYWPEVKNKYQNNMDISQVTIEEIFPLLETRSTATKTSVSNDIIRFYSLNEALAKARQDEHDVLSVDSLKLYDAYKNEIDNLSQKMFTYVFMICMMEARHCQDFRRFIEYKDNIHYEISSFDYNTDEEYKQAKEKKLQELIEENLEFNYRDFFPEEATYNKFVKFHKLVGQLHEIGNSYSRDVALTKLLPLMKEQDIYSLNLTEAFSFLHTLFIKNNFSSGFGGPAWASIIDHGHKFVKGDINAEVFVDQAFSLEHNGGQIFNKDIIFHVQKKHYWYTWNNEQKFTNNYRLPDNQFLLNSQHHGQMNNFLFNDYPKNFSTKASKKGKLEEYQSLGLIPRDIDNDSYQSMISMTEHNLQALQEIKNLFIYDNPGFIDSLKTMMGKSGSFELHTVLEGARKNGKEVLSFPDSEKDTLFLTSHVIGIHNQSQYHNTNSETKKEKPAFVFEYYDTKAVPAEKQVKEVLGNKAFNLMKMHEMNLPVPKAWVFPATNAHSSFKNKTLWNKNLKLALPVLAQEFQDKKGNPVLCSVRSGSAISMPGMMDTILNVGIDDSNYDYFCKKMGKKVVNQCVIKFMGLFAKSYLNEHIDFSDNFHKALFQFRAVLDKHGVEQNFNNFFPLSAKEQYTMCLHAVFKSWHSERATAYRNHHGIPHDIGTAAIVQEMVFGNLNNQSCTGVAFSRDCISGEKGIIGEFLVKAQGEDVVSGAVTPTNIKEMQAIFPNAYNQLIEICQRLEKETGDIQDIEFTIENNQLYILQKRKAVCSGIAQAKLNRELHEQGLMDKEAMLKGISIDSLLPQDRVNTGDSLPAVSGLIANPGVLRGIVVHNESDMLTYQDLYNQHKHEKNFGWIFYAPLTSPEHAPIMIKTDAFVTGNGGFTSHAAILARSWKKPCVVGVGEENAMHFQPGNLVTLDATHGHIYSGFLPLREGDDLHIKEMVNTLLEHYKVDLPSIEHNNPFQQVLDDINNQPSWMENLKGSEAIANNNTVKTEHFMDLSNKIALMIAKAQMDQRKNKITI